MSTKRRIVLTLQIYILRPMKKLISVVVYCIFVQISSHAQPYDPSKINKKAVVLFNQAMERAENGSLTMATGLFLKAVETDNKYVDAYLALASVYGRLKNYKTSADYYEKAFALDSNYTIEYKYLYSVQLAGMGEFERALHAINEVLDKNHPEMKML